MILGENQQPLVLSDYGLPDSPGYAVDVGNPHLVIFLPGPTSEDTVRKLGPRLENHSFFPNRTNVEFCHVIPDDPGSVRVLMWERGAGRTQACGSGACAVAFAAFKTGKVQGGSVRVVMEGGELLVCMDEQGIVSHRGEAQHVFRGVYDMEKED